MKSPHSWIALALAVGFSWVYLSSLNGVPFHPDESSWIYMSQDFETLFLRRDLNAFTWSPGQPTTPQIEYRLLNAPIPKYLIGLGWWLTGHTANELNSDWNWQLTWDENVQAGHLPAPALLFASRVPGALLAALSTVLMFWIGREVRGAGVGLAAALLSGFNALNLLHGRRAMAEGAALFFSLLAVWVVLWIRQARSPLPISSEARLQPEMGKSTPPWKLFGLSVFAGLAVGLAIASKQTNLVLLPVALLATLNLNRAWRATLQAWFIVLVSSVLTFWILNPILYRDPLSVTQAMIAHRADLAQRQVADAERLFPGQVTPTPLARLRAALLETYLEPLAYWDIPIYTTALQPQVTAYQAHPIHTLTRHVAIGALLLGLTMIGIIFSGLRLWRARALNAEAIGWAWGAATLGLTLLAIPLDWQRYFLPLAPPACLLSALGLEALAQPIRRFYEIRHHHQR